MRRTLVRMEGISKSINGGKILEGLSLSVYEKEILGVTGMSGTGKTVIAEILSGTRSYDEGQIYVSGRQMNPERIARAAETGIYHVSTSPALLPCLTIGENICLPEPDMGAALHFPTKRQMAAIREMLRSLDIRIDSRAAVQELDLWERHIVAILRAYYLHARLIIIDDITNDYTEEEFRKLGKLLLKLKQRGVSILFVESMLERAVSFTDRMVILRNGRDEGVLFRCDYSYDDIVKIMIGDYSVPQAVEKRGWRQKREVLLSADQIWDGYLKGLSFYLEKGEVIGFIDEEKNVCDELSKLFLGNRRLLRGEICLEGKAVNVEMDREMLIKAGFGYVEYYKKSIFPKLSLKDNLTITSLDRLTNRTVINSKLEKMVVQDLLNRLDIPLENLRKPVEDISNREQLVAALYKWILNRSRVVVLNNVLSGTDVIMYHIMARFLNELREKEAGALFFFPNTKALYELCDRIYLIRDGVVVKTITL